MFSFILNIDTNVIVGMVVGSFIFGFGAVIGASIVQTAQSKKKDI